MISNFIRNGYNKINTSTLLLNINQLNKRFINTSLSSNIIKNNSIVVNNNLFTFYTKSLFTFVGITGYSRIRRNQTTKCDNNHIMIDYKQMGKDLLVACKNDDITNVLKLVNSINNNINNDNDDNIKKFINVIDENINDREKCPLIISSINGNIDIVRLLLSVKGIDINKSDSHGYTALKWACLNGHTEVVKLLLNQINIDVNKADDYGETPLIEACFDGSIDIVRLLLSIKNIDIHKCNDSGCNALMFACKNGHNKVVEHLLSFNDIDINKSEDINGDTSLIYASSNGHIDIVRLLLSHKDIDINKCDNLGTTARTYAARNLDIKITELIKNHSSNNY